MMENKMVMGVGALIVIVLVGGGAFFFMNSNGTAEPATEVTVDTQPSDANTTETTSEADSMTGQAGSESADEEGVRVFEVDGSNFEFSLEEIRVNEGDTVRIVFNNTGGNHDWTIDEFNAATEVIGTGETDTVEFVADQAGTFEYYCSVGNHRALGMVGNLIVE